jgi:molybdopterin-containing oxidoreductase family membrane subunit
MTLAIPAREFFGLKELITLRHLENMAKIILATSCIVGYAYSLEIFTAWYSGSDYERFAFLNRAFGPMGWAYGIMVIGNVLAPQLLWFKKVRTNLKWLFSICILVNIGMWFERFVIIVGSLSRDFLPSSWGEFSPTWVDIGMLIGSFGMFFMFFLLFCRFLPMVAMAEVKAVLPHDHRHEARGDARGPEGKEGGHE